ncbi:MULTISPECIES: hypothetical protein [Burkholderia]|uniref:hypothetical protein n=1 Tax=Burkholderia TaxID=32008 RepID=UPI000D4D2745|nr:MULTISPECIES: hypothetical protein [Burkholderia]PRD87503.1 hypothetical protein C6P88_28955 [Burkholderia contaminans]
MAELTVEQINDLKMKFLNGTATSEELAQLSAIAQKQAEETKKVESSAKSIVDTIKKAKIAPQILTNLLASEGLIVLPKLEEKTIVHVSPCKTKTGNDSEFEIWAFRDLVKAQGPTKEYWLNVWKLGKDEFIKALNEDGQKLLKDDPKFVQWIDNIFQNTKAPKAKATPVAATTA